MHCLFSLFVFLATCGVASAAPCGPRVAGFGLSELCAPATFNTVLPAPNPLVIPTKNPVIVPAPNPIVVEAERPKIYRQPAPSVYMQTEPKVYEQPAPEVFLAPAKGVECADVAEFSHPLTPEVLPECAPRVEWGEQVMGGLRPMMRLPC